MKKLFILLVFYPVLLFSQQTVKEKTVNSNRELTQSYDVLKSDRNVRHGEYEKRIKGNLMETGFYKQGQKDSLWQRYNEIGILFQGDCINQINSLANGISIVLEEY